MERIFIEIIRSDNAGWLIILNLILFPMLVNGFLIFYIGKKIERLNNNILLMIRLYINETEEKKKISDLID